MTRRRTWLPLSSLTWKLRYGWPCSTTITSRGFHPIEAVPPVAYSRKAIWSNNFLTVRGGCCLWFVAAARLSELFYGALSVQKIRKKSSSWVATSRSCFFYLPNTRVKSCRWLVADMQGLRAVISALIVYECYAVQMALTKDAELKISRLRHQKGLFGDSEKIANLSWGCIRLHDWYFRCCWSIHWASAVYSSEISEEYSPWSMNFNRPSCTQTKSGKHMD